MSIFNRFMFVCNGLTMVNILHSVTPTWIQQKAAKLFAFSNDKANRCEVVVKSAVQCCQADFFARFMDTGCTMFAPIETLFRITRTSAICWKLRLSPRPYVVPIQTYLLLKNITNVSLILSVQNMKLASTSSPNIVIFYT